MQYFHAFLFSIFLHFLIVSFLDKMPDPNLDRDVPVEIVYPDLDKQKARTIVRETEKEDKTETEDEKKARFLSERNKRFKEETRVRDTGLTQNAGGPGQPKSEQKSKPGPGKVAKKFIPLPNPFGNSTPGKQGARSVVGEKIPENVKFGNFNALNTDRYLYYTFFSRIEERIRPRWESNVRDVLEQANPSRARKHEWLTQVEVLLDKKGNFQRVILHKKSGLEGLDMAAIEAFRLGSPYQNPPLEMVQDDGRIHLYYSISVSSAF
jgi:hypothetical protein